MQYFADITWVGKPEAQDVPIIMFSFHCSVRSTYSHQRNMANRLVFPFNGTTCRSPVRFQEAQAAGTEPEGLTLDEEGHREESAEHIGFFVAHPQF